MVSTELIRRYPFFAGLSYEDAATIAKLADEITADTGHYFFREDEELNHLYLNLEGSVAIVFGLPAKGVQHKVSDQLLHRLQREDIVVSTIGPGEIFGWSALVAPYLATAGAKALTPCRVVTIQAVRLRELFEDDCKFGFLMTTKVAQVIRDRLRDLRIESLALAGT